MASVNAKSVIAASQVGKKKQKSHMVQVSASSISGELLVIEAPVDATVGDLKVEVAARWQIPVLCQSWVHDTKVLGETDRLATLLAESGLESSLVSMPELCLTVIITLEKAIKSLSFRAASMRQKAAEALGKVALPDPARVVAALATCIVKDKVAEVRHAALASLARIPTARGNSQAVAAFAICLHRTASAAGGYWRDGSVEVRKAAAEALASAADQADEHQICQATMALSAVSLLDCDEVRVIAMASLGVFNLPGDGTAFGDISERLNHRSDERIRCAATDDMEAAAREGNLLAIAVICERLRDDMLVVRGHALQAVYRGWETWKDNFRVAEVRRLTLVDASSQLANQNKEVPTIVEPQATW